MFKRIGVVLVVVILLLVMVACQPVSAKPTITQAAVSNSVVSDPSLEGDEIRLGFYGPLTGPSAQIGSASYDGAVLAAEQINAKGGVLGKKIRIVYYDDKSSPEQAVKVTTRMITVDKVHGIVGSLHSGNILAGGQIVEDAKIPEIGIGTSPVWLQKGWTYLFRPLPNTSTSSEALIVLCQKLGLKKMAIFHSQDEFGKVGKDNMLKIAESGGLEILGVESFKPGDADFTGQFMKLLNQKPDVFYIIAVGNELGPILKQLREKGYEGYTVGDNAFAGVEVKEIAGKKSDKAIFVAAYTIPTNMADVDLLPPKLKQFVNDYYDRFGKIVESECAYRGYDAVNIFAEAIKTTGSLDGTKIRDAIENLHDFEGLAGVFDYRGNHGEGIKTLRAFIIMDGKDVLIEDYLKTIGK